MDNEFDHIFREAGKAYRVQPPKSVWKSIWYELDEARGYRLLQWIWPMRLAVAFLVVGASLVSVIESYDTLAVSKSEPIDYNEVARELGMIDDVSENSLLEQESFSTSLSSDKLPSENLLKETTVDNKSNTQLSTNEKSTFTQPQLSSDVVVLNGKTNKTQSTSPLLMHSLHTLDIPIQNPGLSVMSPNWQYINADEIPSVSLDRNWYLQLSYHLGGWNVGFNTESLLSLYQYDDPYLTFIPDTNPTFIQNINEAWMAQIEFGYRISNHIAVESGIHLSHLEGSQRTILNVEEQNRYTLERSVAVPTGFNGQRIISFEEEVIDSQILRDTLTSSFSYQSVFVPINLIFSARKNKLGAFAGPSLGVQFWNRIETTSSSALYPELNQTKEVLIAKPTETRLGAVFGAQYFVTNQFSLMLDGSLNQHIPTSINTITLENYQSWQVGLGIRYDF